MCLRGLGARTKDGAIMITASVSGGAVVPAIMKGVTDHRGPQSVQYSFCVVVAFFCFGSILPIYTTLFPVAKQQVDPIGGDSESAEPPVTSNRRDRIFRVLTRRKETLSELPHVRTHEHL